MMKTRMLLADDADTAAGPKGGHLFANLSPTTRCLQVIRQRARQITADLKPDDDEEADPVHVEKDRREPSFRQSAPNNPEEDSLIRLRNNFFADADSLMRDSGRMDNPDSSRRLPSIR